MNVAPRLEKALQELPGDKSWRQFFSPCPLEAPARFEVADLCSFVISEPATSWVLLAPDPDLVFDKCNALR